MQLRTRPLTFIAVYCLAYVLAGLYPFDFDFSRTLHIYPIGTAADVLWNIVAFVPFGWALASVRLTRPCLAATVFCTVFALCIESLQTFVPERFPQIADVICNAAGGWFGAWSWPHINRHRAAFERKLSKTVGSAD